ncbi:MAG: NYN domain-containing protein [Eubacterium sp.]|nr:NYN domain-containing protein [Eubacterium sp.]
MENELRFAVLIDADNVSEKYIKIILEETANNGVATYKRIYGDWTSSRMTSWKSVLLDNSIIPMQQYSYTTGKNATDSAMIIDAMDILYSDTVDGFCIVSSDSDFTRLVARLREQGKQVIGMGESKTPQPFISACNQFKYLDLLYEQKAAEEAAESAEQKGTAKTAKTKEKAKTANRKTKQQQDLEKKRQKDLNRVRNTIDAIMEQFSDEDGWIFSGKLGDQLSKRMPDFDVRNFGFSKFTAFIKSLGSYEYNEIKDSNNQKQIYFRRK